jgi:hypothetical protein
VATFEEPADLARHLVEAGRLADALDLLTGQLPEMIEDPDLGALHEQALSLAFERGQGVAAPDECPCGLGRPWSVCCRPREEAALAAFADRSGLYELRDAVREFMESTGYGPAIEQEVVEWLRTADANRRGPAAIEALSRLAYEHAWLTAGVAEDDDNDCVLRALATDPATPARIAAAARTWRDEVRYGLWQVTDLTPAPGISLIDIVTGFEAYVAVAPEQMEGVVKWSVLVGAIVPLDGAWRTTGTLTQASPTEADVMVEYVRDATSALSASVAGGRARPPRHIRGPVAPHNVYAFIDDPTDPEVARVVSNVVGVVMPFLLAMQLEGRSTPPTLANTDGEPISLIKARVSVHDGVALATLLETHPDFDSDDDEPERWTWLGAIIPPAERSAMLAEVKAQLGAEGEIDADYTPRRVRGSLVIDGDDVRVEVNSTRRLDRLVEILTDLGAKAKVVDQSSFDPTQDLAWPAGPLVLGGGAAPAGTGWETAWLDLSVPAIGGRTPRQVARSRDWPLLEGLLRQFEWDAAIAGRSGDDIAWLRSQLEMPVERLV